MTSKKTKLKLVIKTVMFIVIVSWLYTRITYLFRNADIYRDTILGIKEEEDIDVVCLGASDVMQFFQPLRAFKQEGFTSYTLATSGAPAETMRYQMDYSRKYVNPKLYVISLRDILISGGIDFQNEGYFRNVMDSYDIGFDRNKYLFESFKNRIDYFKENDKSPIPFYCDFLYYHDNYEEVLSSKKNWKHINNRAESSNCGYRIDGGYTNCFGNDMENLKQAKSQELSENQKFLLDEIIEYLDENHLDALFVITPCEVSEYDQEKYNYMISYVESRGYKALDVNQKSSETGINFKTDFADSFHVNVLGAEKYTDYLADFIKNNYEVEDRRNDINFESWNLESERFEKDILDEKECLYSEIEKAENLRAEAKEIEKTDDVGEWIGEVKDNSQLEFVVFTDGIDVDALSDDSKEMISKLGLDYSELNDHYASRIKETETSEISFSDEPVQFEMRAPNCMANYYFDKNAFGINVCDRDYIGETGCINILVWNFNYYEPVDFVNLCIKDGKIVLNRVL